MFRRSITHVAWWRKYGKLAGLGKLWFQVSFSVKDCLNMSGWSFLSYFLHCSFFFTPPCHTLVSGGYIRVLVSVSMICPSFLMPLSSPFFWFFSDKFEPRLFPFLSEIANENFILYPTRFFRFSLAFSVCFGGCALLSVSIRRVWLFQGRETIYPSICS